MAFGKNYIFDKEKFKNRVTELIKIDTIGTIEEATPKQIFRAVAFAVRELISDEWVNTAKTAKAQDKKMVYYLSMEFLMGRALGNDIIAIGADRQIREALDELGVDLNAIEDEEPNWALGNGGLGRLAACFLDSISTLGYHAYGCGIRYQYGMFKQVIVDGAQKEIPDDWLSAGNPFEIRRDVNTQEVHFGGSIKYDFDEKGEPVFSQVGYDAVLAVPYDTPVIGYNNGVVNTLRIWNAEPITKLELDAFGRGDYEAAARSANAAATLCKVLYPADEHMAGKELRLKPQYFFVSATLQRALKRYMETHDDISRLYEKVVFQMNDTHPTVAVGELMRLLIDEYGMGWDAAWNTATKCLAYTNHTIMAEASEKWPISLFSHLLPRVYMIIDEINKRFVEEIRRRYPGDEEKVNRMAILYDGQVRMANLAIVGSFSVNGVAKLHTEILKAREFRDFYEMWPEKFNNKTNGVTQRRFMCHANPLYTEWIDSLIGEGWKTDLSQLSGLKNYLDDENALSRFAEIKRENKKRLAEYIKKHNGIDVDIDSIFDVQVKRLHEYKRQLLNILHVICIYNRIKANPDIDIYPRTYIFGGKAAAGYLLAKQTIELINAVGRVVNNDPDVRGRIKVVFIEEYNVSNAELIFAASDVSEQISTASKEASGTGNMKFMLNGAVTIGTMDGANVEIFDEVGTENGFVFGLSAQEVIDFERDGGYDPMDIFRNDTEIRDTLMTLVNGAFSPDEPGYFRPVYDSLLNTNVRDKADMYFILKDFRSYDEAQNRIDAAYRDQKAWRRMALTQTACAGKFSSDRTIQEYVDDIWHLEKLN